MEVQAVDAFVETEDYLKDRIRELFELYADYPDAERDYCEQLLLAKKPEWIICEELEIHDGLTAYRSIKNYLTRLLSKSVLITSLGTSVDDAKEVALRILDYYNRLIWFDVLEMSNDARRRLHINKNISSWIFGQTVSTYFNLLPKFSSELLMREFYLDACQSLGAWVNANHESSVKEFIAEFGIEKESIFREYDVPELLKRCGLRPNYNTQGFISNHTGGIVTFRKSI